MTTLTRRNLVAAAALAPALAAPSVARAQTKRWRMVTSWPKRLPGPGMSAERVAERIAALSGGRLQITVSAAGEVVPAFEVLDAVGGGVAEMGHTAAFYWQGKMPAANVLHHRAVRAHARTSTSPGSRPAAGRRCGTSFTRRSASSPSWAATPACAWAAGSAARSKARSPTCRA